MTDHPASPPADDLDPATIVVIGATGKTGRRVLAELSTTDLHTVGVSRRTTPSFDWTRPETWAPILTLARAAYVVPPEGPEAVDIAASFAATATTCGVAHLVVLSARVWDELDTPSAVDDAFRSSDVPVTLVRPTWFFQNFTEEAIFADAIATGVLELPAGNGREPFIDLDDLAQVVVEILRGQPTSTTIDLSGGESFTFAHVAEALAAHRQSTVTIRTVTGDSYRKSLIERGFDPSYAADTTDLITHSASGRSDRLSSGVADVLGRPPRTLTEWLTREGSPP